MTLLGTPGFYAKGPVALRCDNPWGLGDYLLLCSRVSSLGELKIGDSFAPNKTGVRVLLKELLAQIWPFRPPQIIFKCVVIVYRSPASSKKSCRTICALSESTNCFGSPLFLKQQKTHKTKLRPHKTKVPGIT